MQSAENVWEQQPNVPVTGSWSWVSLTSQQQQVSLCSELNWGPRFFLSSWFLFSHRRTPPAWRGSCGPTYGCSRLAWLPTGIPTYYRLIMLLLHKLHKKLRGHVEFLSVRSNSNLYTKSLMSLSSLTLVFTKGLFQILRANSINLKCFCPVLFSYLRRCTLVPF